MKDTEDTRDPRKRIKPELREWKARKFPEAIIDWVDRMEPLLATHLASSTQFYSQQFPALRDPLPEGAANATAAAYTRYIKNIMQRIDMLRPAPSARLLGNLEHRASNEHEDFMAGLPYDVSLQSGLYAMCSEFLHQMIMPELSKRMYALATERGRGGPA